MQELTIKQKLTNYYYFIGINSLIAVCIGFCYFFSACNANTPLLGVPQYIVLLLFTVSSHISVIVLLSFTIGIIVLPAIFFTNKIRLSMQAIFASCCLTLLFFDTHEFHLNGIHFTDFLFFKPSVIFLADIQNLFNFISSISITIAIILCFLELSLVFWLDKSTVLTKLKLGKFFFISVGLLFVLSQIIYYTGSPLRKNYITAFTKHLPLYHNTEDNLLTNNWQVFNQYSYNIKDVFKSKLNNINYPLKPLVTDTVKQPPNIIIIGIDAWRADFFNAENSPNLWSFAQSGTIFNQHMSSGNATVQGLFGLFYGLTATHWYSFLKQQKSPLLIDRLQQLNYQIGVFVSTGVKTDKLDKTTFNKIPNLRLGSKGNTPVEWDKNSTEDWLKWYANIDKAKPFFSFVFYYSPHEHDFPETYSKQYKPSKGKSRYTNLVAEYGEFGFIKSYQLAVEYVDSIANKIIKKLENTNVLDNTLIIITGDHGSELNDHKQHHYGHGSNFTDCQIQVPLAIIGPKFEKHHLNNKANDLTTHYDIVPTIMKNFLGIKNKISDYSIGIDLLDKNSKNNYHLATNGNLSGIALSFGIINKDNIQQYFPSGKYRLLDKHNKEMIKTKAIYNYLPEAIEKITRFLK